MASPEVIGLLCAGATNYHPLRGGSDGVLVRSEYAGLLTGLSNDAVNLALAKYGCDLDAERLLIASVRVYAAGLAVCESWQLRKGVPTLMNLAALAVFEVVRPNRCERCGGRGVGKRYATCRKCNGDGVSKLSGRQIAEGMLIDECNFRRLWKTRFEAVYRHVAGLDSDVCLALRVNDRRDNLEAFESFG